MHNNRIQKLDENNLMKLGGIFGKPRIGELSVTPETNYKEC
jgi:hypothetical protein